MNGTSVKDPTVSIMKGIAILSVVIGHATTGTSMEIFVNQYHLAVFSLLQVIVLILNIYKIYMPIHGEDLARYMSLL